MKFQQSTLLARIGRSPIKAFVGITFICFAALYDRLETGSTSSQTVSNAQSNGRFGPTFGLGESSITQQESAHRDDDLWTWLTRFYKAGGDLGYLVNPATRSAVSIGVSAAFAMAIHYNNNRPHPRQCNPRELDKWQHCYVGCKISSWCPVGSVSASLLAVLKELRDVMGRGEFSWADVLATLEGTWDCPVWESCEEFCCKQFG